MYISTPSQMKIAEANAVENNNTYIGLMENAGKALVDEILIRIPDISEKSALILCGKGNNGGDGFVLARLLCEIGTQVSVVLFDKSQTGIALEELEKIRCTAVNICDTPDFSTNFSVIVDCVFGTGFHGELPDNIGSVMSRLQASSALKIAADVPSGINCITGEASKNTLICDCTVTFGAVKAGMLFEPAKSICGEIILSEIGITRDCFEKIEGISELVDDAFAAKAIPARNEKTHKGTFGRLTVIAGSRDMSGAAALNVSAALRSGAGLVRLASTAYVTNRVACGIYEATLLELIEKDGAISSENADRLSEAMPENSVCALGSGLTCTADTVKLVKSVINICKEKKITLIIDADGLNCIQQSIDIIKSLKGVNAVLTPHAAELARLVGTNTAEVLADRLNYAKRLCKMSGAVVVSKGVPTYIVSPDGRVYASFTGNGGLSRGGSGDVLTGVISGITAMNKGENLPLCVCAGVYIFGLAADIAAQKLTMTAMLPTDVTANLPYAFKKVRPENIRHFNVNMR